MEPLQAAARSLETARLSGSDDALTSAFGELRALGVDVSSGDVDVIAANLKARLEPATALFFEKRDAARVLLTGTADEITTRETTGDGTGRSRRYVFRGAWRARRTFAAAAGVAGLNLASSGAHAAREQRHVPRLTHVLSRPSRLTSHVSRSTDGSRRRLTHVRVGRLTCSTCPSS